jgi:hypothetical protein
VVRVTFVLGLAGSGKSYVAEQLRLATGAIVFDGLLGPDHQDVLGRLMAALAAGKDCVVEEIALCRRQNRDVVAAHLRSELPNVEMAWICFENNPDDANWNVTNRLNKREVENHLYINRQVNPNYTYPEGAEIKKICRVPPLERSP